MLHDTFITNIPKAELHLHIEGSLEPELMFRLAKRNRISIPFQSVEDVKKAYNFNNLQDFLDIYYAGASVLQTAEDFHDLATAYFARAAADGVTHTEIFFDPQTHTTRGIPFDVVMEGLLSGIAEAKAQHGISVLLIMCFLRHLDEDSAFATFKSAEKWISHISGVGLDSSELGHPPSKFARVFAAAGSAGLMRVAHAGEEGPPSYVVEALDLLNINRLDHGNRALEDAVLTARLAREAMTLTVCPLSNLKLCVVDNLNNHPVNRMLDAGLRVTINSDDPAYFGGYINDNFRALVAAGKVSREDIITLARNSFLGSFLKDEDLATQIEALNTFVAAHTVSH